MTRPYEFSIAGTPGTARYRDGEWHVEIDGRTASHRVLRVALARAIGAAPTSVAGLAQKLLDEARRERPPEA